MKTKTLIAAACAAFCSAAIAAKIDADWCTVEFPEQWNFREETKGFDVTVTLKKGAPTEGNWLQPHLHWMKAGGYGGFQAWQNPVKKPVVGKTYRFHYKPKVDEDKVHRFIELEAEYLIESRANPFRLIDKPISVDVILL
jgi:hypothetical protein